MALSNAAVALQDLTPLLPLALLLCVLLCCSVCVPLLCALLLCSWLLFLENHRHAFPGEREKTPGLDRNASCPAPLVTLRFRFEN